MKKNTSVSFKPVKEATVKAAPSTCQLWAPTLKVKTGVKAGGGACFGAA